MNKNLFLDFSRQLRQTSTLDAQKSLLKDTLQTIGFDSFLYAVIPAPQVDSPDEFIACTNFDENWLAHYDEMEMFQNDYAAHHCTHKTDPLLWADMFASIDNGTLDARFKPTADSTREWSYGNGLSLPIRHFGTSSAALSVVANADLSATEATRAFRHHQDDLLLIANAFHANVDRPIMVQKYFDISEREIEVLKWLLDGYLVKQISHKTGRSPHTINKQIQSAKNRLNCSTTSQAVARAVVLEII